VGVVDSGQNEISEVADGGHVGQLTVVDQLVPDLCFVAESVEKGRKKKEIKRMSYSLTDTLSGE
jgi:hypothetical protein